MSKSSQLYETDRLILEPLTERHADLILGVFNSVKFIQFVGDRKIRSIDEATAFIRQTIIPQRERLGYSNFAIIRKTDLQRIGICGLFDRDELEGIDLGFGLLPEFEGQGFAFEAAMGVMDLAFNEFGLNELKAITSEKNEGSLKLLKKLGFQEHHTTLDGNRILFFKAIP